MRSGVHTVCIKIHKYPTHHYITYNHCMMCTDQLTIDALYNNGGLCLDQVVMIWVHLKVEARCHMGMAQL